ncbi:MAG: hypothetical protein ABIH42_00495 [Planctomycetota bacterium]
MLRAKGERRAARVLRFRRFHLFHGWLCGGFHFFLTLNSFAFFTAAGLAAISLNISVLPLYPNPYGAVCYLFHDHILSSCLILLINSVVVRYREIVRQSPFRLYA